MHHIVTSKYASQCRPWQRIDHANVLPNTGKESRPFRLATVRRLYNQPGVSGTHPFARFFETCNGLPSATGEAKQLADPPDQRRIQHDREIGGHQYRTASGPGKRTRKLTRPVSLAALGFYHIPGRTQPDSPAGQPCSQVGDQGAIRTNNEPDHLLLGQPRPRHDAAAKRTSLGLQVGVKVLGWR